MSSKVNSRPQWRRLLPAGLGAGVIVIVGATLVLARTTRFAAGMASAPTYAAERGPLTISVSESGTIKSQEQVILKNEVEGQTTLIYLIPEGTRVAKDQLLAELDASKLQDDRVEQQIKVDNAEAAFIQATENLAVVKNQAESDTSKAELTYRFAQEDVKKYLEGEFPQAVLEADSKITIAREDAERAAEKLRWSERLYEEKYISQTELQADSLAKKKAELDLTVAIAAKELLEGYTHARELAQLESDVEQAKLALERTQRKANADVVQAEATLKAKEAEFKQQQSKLAKLEEQIKKSKLVAPREGLVVYATSTRTGGGRGGMTQPLEEGQSIRERQELIYLPSTQAMMAELMIHESSLEKVQPGQPVYVSVDAMPGRTFVGRVRSIAPLPDAQSMFMNADRKVYATKVYLDGNNAELRTGMSCRAEILIERLDDAVYVPVQAVVRVGGQPTVYVRGDDDFQPRNVEIGLDNSNVVHIKTGLAAGELVSLTPPLEAGATRFIAALPPQQPLPMPASGPMPMASSAPADGEQRVGSDREQPARAGGEMSEEERAARRARFQNMTPEERAAERRRRMESMTPEQREELMRRMRERQAER
ncbi:MAG: efflux RND transporter periplasmic adaptor subunit, partial [Planctomycetota bacterium]